MVISGGGRRHHPGEDGGAGPGRAPSPGYCVCHDDGVLGMMGRILPSLLSPTVPLLRPLSPLLLIYFWGDFSSPVSPSGWFCFPRYFFKPQPHLPLSLSCRAQDPASRMWVGAPASPPHRPARPPAFCPQLPPRTTVCTSLSPGPLEALDFIPRPPDMALYCGLHKPL